MAKLSSLDYCWLAGLLYLDGFLMPTNSMDVSHQMDDFLRDFHDGYRETLQYRPSDIAKEANVSVKSVHRWLRKETAVHPAHKSLIELHIQGSILPASWKKNGHRFIDDHLVLDYGAYRFSQQDMNTHWLTVQTEQSALREVAMLKEYVAYLEKLLPRSDVIPLEPGRASEAKGRIKNPYFNFPSDRVTRD